MTIDKNLIGEMVAAGRQISLAERHDPKLGPLRWLPGTWQNTTELSGHGFNMIALPFGSKQNSENGYRLLMNQYEETIVFDVADIGVPNRGMDPDGNQTDQTAVALGYKQVVKQVSYEDSYLVSAAGQQTSTLASTDISEKFNGNGIHHEPGLWIFMTDQNISRNLGNGRTEQINVARMGSIPHGNSFLAAGSAKTFSIEDITDDLLKNLIPNINGVVVGGGSDPEERSLEPIVNDKTGIIDIDYFAPYRFFNKNPFKGNGCIAGFDGFEPVHSTKLLDFCLQNFLRKVGDIKQIVRLRVDSTIDHAGINRVSNPSIGNTPFITRQADTTAMNATFFIYEIEDAKTGKLRYFLQYAQNVILDFIGRPDGHPGRARWPHVSINTLERVSTPSDEAMAEFLQVS